MRRAEDPEYWCKAAFKSIDAATNINYVITDWRFHNEAKYTIDNYKQVLTIRIYRSDVPEPSPDIQCEHDLDNYCTDFLLVPGFAEQNHDDDIKEFEKAIEKFPQYKGYIYCGEI